MSWSGQTRHHRHNINLAHNLNMTVIAEGRRDARQKEQLRALAATCQGFYFAATAAI
jgi:EAL domain-containing protein (putative c-di-GMP-specific phosphodiesterase class I)